MSLEGRFAVARYSFAEDACFKQGSLNSARK